MDHVIIPHIAERDGQRKRLVIEDAEKRKRILACIHNSSHLGLNRTLDMVVEKYYWPGLSTDVKAYVSCICGNTYVFLNKGFSGTMQSL